MVGEGPPTRAVAWGAPALWMSSASIRAACPAVAARTFLTRLSDRAQAEQQQPNQTHKQGPYSSRSRTLFSRGGTVDTICPLRAHVGSSPSVNRRFCSFGDGPQTLWGVWRTSRDLGACTLRRSLMSLGGHREFAAAADPEGNAQGLPGAAGPPQSGSAGATIRFSGGGRGGVGARRCSTPREDAKLGREPLGASSLECRQGPPRRFAVVDGSCVLFRCYHAMPPLKNREGDNVGAVMGFFRSLVQIRRLLAPSHLAVVFDHPTGRSSRLAISDSYKSHRTHPPLELTEQLQKAKYLCAAMGLCPLEVEGVEGDDVIATLVDRLCGTATQHQRPKEEEGEFDEVVVATVDKDLLQLLRYNYESKQGGPLVKVLALHRQFRLVDQEFVKDEYGVHPHQLLDFFSLVGDRADGIVGCRGIGMAAAKKVLQTVEGLEELLEAPESLKQAALRSGQLSSLLAFLPQWETNRRLVALDCGVLPARAASLADFRLREVGVEDLRKMFAPYNLSKQADLWVQAGEAAPCGPSALQSPPSAPALPLPKVSLTIDMSLPTTTTPLKSRAAATAEAAAPSTGAGASAAATSRAVEPHRAEAERAADVSRPSTGDAAEEAPPCHSRLSAFGRGCGSSAVSAHDLVAPHAVGSLLRGAGAGVSVECLQSAASELQSEGRVAAAASATTQTAAATVVAARGSGPVQHTTHSAVSNTHDTQGLWGFLSSLWPSGMGVPVMADAREAPVTYAKGQSRYSRLGRRRLALLLDPHSISQCRLLLSCATETPKTAGATSAVVGTPPKAIPAAVGLPEHASLAAIAGATEGTPAATSAPSSIAASAAPNTPVSSPAADSSTKTTGTCSGSTASGFGEAADPVDSQLHELPPRRSRKASLDRNDSSNISSVPEKPVLAADIGAATASSTTGTWTDQVRCLLQRERAHADVLKRHMQQHQQVVAAVEATAAAAAEAAATSLKSARARALRGSARRASNADDGDSGGVASDSSGGTASGASAPSGTEGESSHKMAGGAAVDARPLLPPIECRGSFAFPSPLEQAEAFQSTLALCLHYLSLLQKAGELNGGSSNSSHAGAVAGTEGLLRRLPEPISIDPLQVSLSAMDGSDASCSNTGSRLSCNSSSISSGICPHGGSLLLPVSVAWLAASPSYPHAPVSSLCPIHLTFCVRVPSGLLQSLLREQQEKSHLGLHLLEQEELVYFHFEVSRLLQDPAATLLLHRCLQTRRLSDLFPVSSSLPHPTAYRPEETPAEIEATTAADTEGEPRVVWAVHDAKQLMHLLLNVGLSPPPVSHVHCTSVLAWLLHGADSKTSDLLQQATLYSLLLQQHRQPNQMLPEPPATATPPALRGATEPVDGDSSNEGPEIRHEEGGEPVEPLACQNEKAGSRKERAVQGSTASLLPLLGSPVASLIVEVMTKAAAALAGAQRRGRGAKAAGGADVPPLKDGRHSWSPAVQVPWRSVALARRFLLPPEQHQLQQGLFGRFGWGIYSKRPQKKARGTILKGCSSSTTTTAGSSGLRLCFQPVVAAPGAASTPQDPFGGNTCVELDTQQRHSQDQSSAGISTSSSIRFPPRFRRCCPPRCPESLDPQDIQAFCEARSAATLVLLETQQLLLLEQQRAAEERFPYPREAGCLSLALGVWAQVERPLLPALVALERRGLSLSTSVLTDGWRSKRGSALLAQEEQQGIVSSLSQSPPAGLMPEQDEEAACATTGGVAALERPQTKKQQTGDVPQIGDCSEALEQQRQLERKIWRQIEQLTGSGEINLNSPSQLATLLYDVLQLPPPLLAFPGASSPNELPQSSKRSSKGSSTSSGSRSTGAEALQALLREARSNHTDPRSRQVAALLSALLEYRASHKFVSTYFASLPSYIFPPTNRIHVSLLQTGASTGRLACRNPNLQNIPNHQEEWRWIRRAFIPSAVKPCKAVEGTICGDALSDALVPLRPSTPLAGTGSPLPATAAEANPLDSPHPPSPWRFLSIDYSQMELHILAYLSNDLQLLSDLRGGACTDKANRRFDSFQLTASRLFGCRPEEVTKERRSAAKTVTYGILYGQTEGGLSRQLQVPLKDARRLIDCFFSEYRGVQTLTRTHTQFAEATGTIETLVGRSRRLDSTDAVYERLEQHEQLAALLQHIGAARKLLQQKTVATNSSERNKSRCRRQAMNTPIQGLAADIMKYATARVEQLLHQQQQRAFDYQQKKQQQQVLDSPMQPKGLRTSEWVLRRPVRAQVVLQIHDELLLEVHEEDVELTLKLVLPLMQRAWGLLLVETGCLDRYAALCQVQKRLSDGHQSRSNEGDAMMHSWALQAAGNDKSPSEEKWFTLPSHYEWLRPLLQRTLPTSSKVGCDWACC